MADAPTPAPDRFTDVLAAYLEAVDAGWAPPRQQFLARYPDLAGELHTFFLNEDQTDAWAEPLRTMSGIAKPNGKSATAATPTVAENEAQVVPWTGGRFFGDYELLEEIARGGMGIVWKARQISLNRVVALKMILAGQLASPAAVQRFRTEAENAANLEHPNIVPIHEVGTCQGQHFFTMKLIEGGNLAQSISAGQWLVGSPPTHRRAATLVATAAQAVHHAHQRGILHRDLKPANILIDAEGQPHVSDFGLAKRIESGASLTQSGAIVGTPSYMPPEQARGKKDLTVAADVYSLGAILYELLAGRPPFRADTPMETVLQVMEKTPLPPSLFNPNLERDLEIICLKCLDKAPANRYPSAHALANDLARWLDGDPVTARSISGWERAKHWIKRRPAITALMAVSSLMALALVGIIVALYYNADLKAEAERADELKREAERQAELATEQRETANRYLYVANMNLAQRAWEEANVKRAQELIDRYESTDTELRGFEWYYLWRLCHRRRLWDVNPEALTFRSHKGAITNIAFSPDGLLVASTSSDGLVTFHDMQGSQVHWSESDFRKVGSIAFSADGRLLARTRLNHVNVSSVANPHDGPRFISHGGDILGVAFGPDGVRLASASSDGTVRIWDASTGQELGGQQLIAESGQPIEFKTVALKYGAQGTALAAALKDSKVLLWESAGRKTLLLRGHTKLVRSIAFSPDGARLATASADNTVRVWDTTTAVPEREFKSHTTDVRSVAFSPDGRRLATGSDDKSVRIWDIATGQEILSLRENKSPICCVAFSPNGSRLACGSIDGSITIWDASSP